MSAAACLRLLMLATLLCSCASQPKVSLLGARVPLTPWQDGDVLLSGSSGWRSWIVRSADEVKTPFSHAGLILIENGTPMLLHSTPVDGARTLTMPLADYLAWPGLQTVAIYRARDPLLARAAAREARRYLALAVPFDQDYDINSDATLYCTEMIWRSYLNAGVDLLGNPRRPLRSAPLYGPLIWPSDFTQMPALQQIFTTANPPAASSVRQVVIDQQQAENAHQVNDGEAERFHR